MAGVEKLQEIPWDEITIAKAQKLADEGINVICDGDTKTVLLVPA